LVVRRVLSIGAGPFTFVGGLMLAALVACSTPSAPAPVKNSSPENTMNLRSKSELEALDGQPVVAVGRYDIEDLGKHRVSATMLDGTKVTTNQAVYLQLDDGTDLRVGARPDAERAEFAGKHVAIEARLVMKPTPDDPRAAQMSPMPTLFDVTAVRLAE